MNLITYIYKIGESVELTHTHLHWYAYLPGATFLYEGKEQGWSQPGSSAVEAINFLTNVVRGKHVTFWKNLGVGVHEITFPNDLEDITSEVFNTDNGIHRPPSTF